MRDSGPNISERGASMLLVRWLGLTLVCAFLGVVMAACGSQGEGREEWNEIPGVTPSPLPLRTQLLVDARSWLNGAIRAELKVLATVPSDEATDRRTALLRGQQSDVREAVRSLENYQWISSEAEYRYERAVQSVENAERDE